MTVTSISLGALIALLAASSVAANLIVLYVIVAGGLLNKRQNSIYILSTLNLIGDCAHATFVLGYLAPSSIAQDWLVASNYTEPGARIFAYCFQFCWYQSELTQIAMTSNRLIAVLFPCYIDLFERKRVFVYCTGICVLAVLLSIFADEILPCCSTYFYYGTYSYKFFGPANAFNYKNYFVDIPLNSATSLYSLVCYGSIFATVYKTNRTLKVGDQNMNRRKLTEVRYAAQFAAISLFFLAAWISFRILPLIAPPDKPELFLITLIFVLMHCTANAMVYMLMNKEIKRLLKLKFGFYCPSTKIATISISVATPTKSKNFDAK
ncbi:G-PROTEIN-RECEP-F1-2 domain-containing protein [Aphelenchoides besseyi]|nr:G-PROTEIN-RECEP-F1-2 domain-containing protein [Aphelenchoides besseyi]KAI6198491.1 G-PROTEIN-RECEP-F1-2 domain-containing protein [Aphelenchoides besseyi]